MNRRTLLPLLCLALGAGAVFAQTPAPAMNAPRDWSQALREDARALHDILQDSHPGVHDTLNPGFRERLEAGLQQALARAATTRDAGGWWWALRAYVAGFDDGHVQIFLADPQYGFAARWPGFLTVYRGDAQVVVERDESDPAAPARGARLLDCDGMPAEALAAQRIGAFRGRWFLESQRAMYGDFQFLSLANPWIDEMRACRFQHDGAIHTHTLRWRAIDAEELRERRSAVARRSTPAFGLRRLEDGGFWISMPSFDGTPGGEPHRALTALLADLAAQREALVAAPHVVLDVRGNGGGSSHWGLEVARLLWGPEWTAAHAPPPSTGVDWRASAGNIAEIGQFLAQLRAADGAPELLAWAEQAMRGMQAALAAGAPYWREQRDPGAAPAARPAVPAAVPPVAGQVFVLTDAACASACLDALDLWKAAGAAQVGRETSADSLYMEVRTTTLPSGLAQLGVPMKVYRGRARGNNAPHRPAHVFDGDMTDDNALAVWIRSLQRARLAAGASGGS